MIHTVVDSPSLEVLKGHRGTVLGKLLWVFCDADHFTAERTAKLCSFRCLPTEDPS